MKLKIIAYTCAKNILVQIENTNVRENVDRISFATFRRCCGHVGPDTRAGAVDASGQGGGKTHEFLPELPWLSSPLDLRRFEKVALMNP